MKRVVGRVLLHVGIGGFLAAFPIWKQSLESAAIVAVAALAVAYLGWRLMPHESSEPPAYR